MRLPIILASPVQILRFIFHLPNLIRLILRLLRDPRVPVRYKIFPWFGVCYFILPLDLLRDFPLVYLGYLDDIVVLYLCLKTFLKKCPQEIVQEHIQALERSPHRQHSTPH